MTGAGGMLKGILLNADASRLLVCDASNLHFVLAGRIIMRVVAFEMRRGKGNLYLSLGIATRPRRPMSTGC